MATRIARWEAADGSFFNTEEEAALYEQTNSSKIATARLHRLVEGFGGHQDHQYEVKRFFDHDDTLEKVSKIILERTVKVTVNGEEFLLPIGMSLNYRFIEALAGFLIFEAYTVRFMIAKRSGSIERGGEIAVPEEGIQFNVSKSN
jgi:hypothetical protein